MAKQSEKEFLLATNDNYHFNYQPVLFLKGKTEDEGFTANVEEARVFTGKELVELEYAKNHRFMIMLKGAALKMAVPQISQLAIENLDGTERFYRPARTGETSCKDCLFRNKEYTKSFNYKHSTCIIKGNKEKLKLNHTCQSASLQIACPSCGNDFPLSNDEIFELGCWECQQKNKEETNHGA
jgi:hypothetical protein